ncbi:MAG: PaaI family thioesterase, partial [bacterium]|nr:PaaI family thioesterase [bacterium]
MQDAASLLDAMPFSTACGVEVTEASAGEVHGGVAWDPGRCTTNGILHGGLVMAVADTLGAICAFLNLPEGAGT